MMRFRHTYIRDRLTLWYVGIFGIVLSIDICGACILQYWQSSEQLHHAEIEDLETVEGLLYFTPDGLMHLNEDYHSHPHQGCFLTGTWKCLVRTAGCSSATSGCTNGSGSCIRIRRRPCGLQVEKDAPCRWNFRSRHQPPAHASWPVALIRLAYSTEPLAERLLEFLGLLLLASPSPPLTTSFRNRSPS
jgi:hypothetical protein